MIIFARHRTSSPSLKVQAMRVAGLEVVEPELDGLSLEEQVDAIEKVIADRPDGEEVGVVGDGMGAVAAAMAIDDLVHHYGNHACEGLLLLSPAWHLLGDITMPQVATATQVIHGTQTELTDLELSRRWVKDPMNKKAALLEVQDDCRLLQHLPLIVEHALIAQVGAKGW